MTDLDTRSSLRRRGYLAVLAVLLVLLAGTAGLRARHVAHVEATITEQQAAEVAAALDYIAADFSALTDALGERARRLAQEPRTRRILRDRSEAAGRATEAAITYLADLRLAEHEAAELYDPQPLLMAWNGFSMPPDTAVSTSRFMEGFQTAVAFDEDWRAALVGWWPVRDADTVLGAVRVLYLLYQRVPEQNQYLRDYSLADQWRRATGLLVRVEWQPRTIAGRSDEPETRLLQGPDGTVLARVTVRAPEAEQVIQSAASRFDNVLALWAAALLVWGVAVLWASYRRAHAAAREALRDRARADAVPGMRPPASLLNATRWFVVAAVAWVGLRYAFIILEVPNRWQRGKTPLAPLYDPTHLAAGVGGGLMRSIGDLLLTAVFAIVLAVGVLSLAALFRRWAVHVFRHQAAPEARASIGRAVGLVGIGVAVLLGLTAGLGVLTQHAVFDSTLDYFARSGLMPERLVLLVTMALFVLVASVIVFWVGLVWIAAGRWPGAIRLVRERWGVSVATGLAMLAGGVLVQHLLAPAQALPWSAALLFLATGTGLALWSLVRYRDVLAMLTLRNLLAGVFFLTCLLYVLFFAGVERQQRSRMVDAAVMAEDGQDPWVAFAIEELIEDVLGGGGARWALQNPDSSQEPLAHLAADAVRSSLLRSLGTHDVTMTIYTSDGTPAARHFEGEQVVYAAAGEAADAQAFSVLRQIYEASGGTGIVVTPTTGSREVDRFEYIGMAAVTEADTDALVGWVQVRAEPRRFSRTGGIPFPRVLLPSGYGNQTSRVSVAHFRDGVLERSFGRSFGRSRLADAVAYDLLTREAVWRVESLKGRQYLTYYRRLPLPEAIDLTAGGASVRPRIVAVRVPAVNVFDHLYYLLRLIVAGLVVGLPVYVGGVYLRWRAGLVPASRIQFREKVLNAFLGVGIITVGLVGFVGLQVVTGENERAIRSWLEQHLERVEEALALEAHGDELPYQVLERVRIDSLAARVGLDLIVYDGRELERTSRPRLVQERIIDPRLPVRVYQELFYEGYRFTSVEENMGRFSYTAGFRALTDEQGRPRYVLSVPTLPEQERIEEERARTVAYLFGALLLLVVVVMVTASLLANALAQPLARLRSGLQAVAKGRFAREIPVDTRDEIGELVQTFNEMQQQLADSRRQLAQQERQLAWREMARQVAHEIKNPLTPMKLSVQHLRRAFTEERADAGGRGDRFAGLFDRITTTLIEQIDTLARIANDFSTFARMPTRVLEEVDLNAIVQEAVDLMQEEAGATLTVALDPEPLILQADREELRRIYINLIKNAFQAIPEGSEGEVSVVTRREAANGEPGHGWAYSAVQDTGAGIPAELRGRIFEPNFSTKTSGTGLGLAITKKGVEELHGTIDFETEEGQGTTFHLRLPLVEG